MTEYFLLGVLCLVSPITGQPECAYLNENPIIYYTKEECNIRKVEKTTEMAANLTSKGFEISYIDIQCILDTKAKRLDFTPLF